MSQLDDLKGDKFHDIECTTLNMDRREWNRDLSQEIKKINDRQAC